MKFNLKFSRKTKSDTDSATAEEKTVESVNRETIESETSEGIISPTESESTESISTEVESAKRTPKKKAKKKRKPFNPLAKLIYWFWGAGPPTRFNCKENPFGAYSLRGKFKRWFYIHYRGYCYSITTLYDKPNDVYLYDKELIPRMELSDDSVHVTNEKFTHHLDLDHPKRGFDARLDYGFTAHDAYMYIRCNKIDEAMKIELGEQAPIDYKKILIIVVGVFIAFTVFYMMYMQR